MDNPPVIYFDEQRANDAFEVLRAMEAQEQRVPDLAFNPLWKRLRRGARERFANAFQKDG